MIHRLVLNQTSYFGRGAITQLPDILKSHGFKKALIVTDPVLLTTGTVDTVTAQLVEAGVQYEIFSEVVPNPPVENVLAGVAACKQAAADVLIGLGGGSPQDTAKAIGIIVKNPEFSDVVSLEGVADTKHPSLPIIGIPTTAGTASETTINYVITDKAKNRKFVCVDPHDIPVVAIIDPDLMDSMPRSLRVATGLDALTHAIEGYITRGAWEFSDSVHLTAIKLIAQNLRAAAEGDRDAGEKMAYAAYIAGMGYSNVGLGLVHGMAHPLGGRHNAPHGLANGILLAPVMRYNAPETGEKYRDIAAAFGVTDAYELPLDKAREAACDEVARLVTDLDNPTTLSAIGVGEEDVAALAQDAYADVCTPGNPRQATLEEIDAIYRSIL